jgi:aryl-alcohol dehydrogenase-like predicted oxidoreductase
MQYRILGSTGLKVSEIGLGTWQIGGAFTFGGKQIGWSGMDDRTSKEILKTALDCGINFFDTADVYGRCHSEELIGEFLANIGPNRRAEIILSSKMGNRELENGEWVKDFSPEWIKRSVEGSLMRLRTETIDVYHLHSPGADWQYTGEIVDALEAIRKEGKIRYYGVSLIPPGRCMKPSDQGMTVISSGRCCDFFQVVYNILEREAEEDFLPECESRKLGVIVRVPLQSGFLSGKYTVDTRFPPDDVRHTWYPPERIKEQVEEVAKLSFLTEGKDRTMAQTALQFCLAQPAVSTVIAGARRPEQVVLNAQVSDLPPLTEGELRKIAMAIPPKHALD